MQQEVLSPSPVPRRRSAALAFGPYGRDRDKTYGKLISIMGRVSQDELHAVRYFEVAETVNALRPRTVLELGCGYGFACSLFEADLVVGVDINVPAIQFAKLHFSDSRHAFVRGDLFSIGFQIKFDVVVVSEVIEHLPDDIEALRTALFFLELDGHLVLTVPNLSRLQNLIRGPFGLSPIFMCGDHLREYNLEDVLAFLDNLGCEVRSSRGCYFRLPLEYGVRSLPGLGVRTGLRLALEDSFPGLCTFHLISARKVRAVDTQ